MTQSNAGTPDDNSTGRTMAGYTAADDLLRDLDGLNGEAPRAVAQGYLMAIRDLDAGLDGPTLLAHLRGDNGESMRLTGVGYVMAVRDGMRPPGRRDGAAASRDPGLQMHDDAERVRAWLERSPPSVLQRAISSVQFALAVPPEAPGTRADRGVARLRRLAAHPTWSGLVAAATLALVVALGLQAAQAPSFAQRRALEKDIELSQQVANITALMLEQRRYEKDSFIHIAERDQIDAYARKWDGARQSMATTIDRIGELDLNKPDRQTLDEIERDFRQYTTGYSMLLSRIKSGRVSTAQQANREFEVYKGAAHRIEVIGAALGARALRRLDKLT